MNNNYSITKYASLIKEELALELGKQGSSLEEFEKSLASVNTGEGVYKIAKLLKNIFKAENANTKLAGYGPDDGILGKFMDKGIGFGGSLPELAFKSSLAGGAIAGLATDEMDKSIESANKALAREREKIKLVQRLTANLRREHGLI
jgi:hypothetical protein